MERKPFRFALSAVLGAFTVVAVSQTPALSHQDRPSPKASMMPMQDMMRDCMKHCQATSTSIDQSLKQIQAAKKSNDPKQMRMALDQAEKSLSGMKEHMGMCMRMMDMHGGMRGGKSGQMGDHGGMMGSPAMDEKGMVTCTMGMKVDPKTAPKATYKGKTYYFCSDAEKRQFEKDPETFLRRK